MMAQPKPKLSEVVRRSLQAKYATIPIAADAVGLPYERLKKALRQNRFSDEDIRALLPDSTADDLSKIYTFDHSRPYVRTTRGPDSARLPASGANDRHFNLFEQISGPFQLLQRAAAATEFGPFVTDLYEHRLDQTYSMVLFCHDKSVPIEWLGGNRPVLLKVANALCNGAKIIYIMEIDLANEVVSEPQEIDLIDRRFKKYLEDVQDACAEIQTNPPSGLIALLRVPHCSFCIPYQKPTLFTEIVDTDEAGDTDKTNSHHALTTIELPQTLSGHGVYGTIVVPQRDEVAAHMSEYLRELIRHVRRIKNEKDKEGQFHFKSEPASSDDELISRLEEIVG